MSNSLNGLTLSRVEVEQGNLGHGVNWDTTGVNWDTIFCIIYIFAKSIDNGNLVHS